MSAYYLNVTKTNLDVELLITLVSLSKSSQGSLYTLCRKYFIIHTYFSDKFPTEIFSEISLNISGFEYILQL